MKFYTQFDPKPREEELFTLPSVTVPDESMTIPEIIARFVRSGTVPVSVHTDIGDNEAFDPDFDPLDFQPTEIVESLRPSKAKDEGSPSSSTPPPSEDKKSEKSPENGE